ncbi:MAG: type II toxin-antitoxin system RelE/ParE family toxin [Rhodospirillales bacterium]
MKSWWSPRATNDLLLAHAYIARNNPTAADRTAARIKKSLNLLLEYPELGRTVPGTIDREFAVPRTPYIVRYSIDGEIIEILAVPHYRQNR